MQNKRVQFLIREMQNELRTPPDPKTLAESVIRGNEYIEVLAEKVSKRKTSKEAKYGETDSIRLLVPIAKPDHVFWTEIPAKHLRVITDRLGFSIEASEYEVTIRKHKALELQTLTRFSVLGPLHKVKDVEGNMVIERRKRGRRTKA